MDTATLVDERIDEGALLLSSLKSNSFDVAAAFWVLTSEDSLWFLYVASSEVDTGGLAAAYRKAYTILAAAEFRWITRSEIKLIGRKNPIALDAITYQRALPTRFGGRKLGNLIIEEAYIYPK